MMNSMRAVSMLYLVYFKYFFQANSASGHTNVYGLDVTIHRNTRVSGENSTTVLNSYDSMSITQCNSECRKRPDCRAVEYTFLAKYCSLRSDVLDIDIAPGRLTVTGFNNRIACKNVTCGAGEACNSQLDTCEIKECGRPVYGQHVMGNRHGIKDRQVYKCGFEMTTLTCADDGEWNQVTNTDGLTCGSIRISNPHAQSGLYKNRLNITMYCELGDDGKDWLVFQRRMDGSVDFYRNWTEYKHGFGDPCGEFWLDNVKHMLCLDKMHTLLTESMSEFEMRVDLENWDNEKRYAVYERFNLGDEDNGYSLLCQGYSGTANDSLTYHNGGQFTTFDKDNDIFNSNCAVVYHGAWWYKACHSSNLNGLYYTIGSTVEHARGIVWGRWKGYNYSMKQVTMKMREKQTL